MNGGGIILSLLPFAGAVVVAGNLDRGYYAQIEENLKDVTFDELAPVDSIAWGSAHASHAIVLFMDFQCPSCSSELQRIVEMSKEAEGVRFVLRHYPLPNHAFAIPAALLAEYSTDHSKIVDFAVLCSRERIYNDGDLQRLAESAGIMAADQDLPEIDETTLLRVRRDLEFARRMMFRGTPTIVYGNRNGDRRLLHKRELVGFIKQMQITKTSMGNQSQLGQNDDS